MKKPESKAASKTADLSTKNVTIQTPETEKKADAPIAPKAEIQPPTPQTPKTSWRKKEEQKAERKQPELFGYAPFQSSSFPTYDPRVHAAINGLFVSGNRR